MSISDNSSSGSFMEFLDNTASIDTSSCCLGICWCSIMNAACWREGALEAMIGYKSSGTRYVRGDSLINSLPRSSLTILRG